MDNLGGVCLNFAYRNVDADVMVPGPTLALGPLFGYRSPLTGHPRPFTCILEQYRGEWPQERRDPNLITKPGMTELEQGRSSLND